MEQKKFFFTIVFILIAILGIGLLVSFTRIVELENRISQLEHRINNPEPKMLPVK